MAASALHVWDLPWQCRKAEFRDGGLGAPQPAALASRNVPLYLMPFLGDRSLSSPSLEFDWIMTYRALGALERACQSLISPRRRLRLTVI